MGANIGPTTPIPADGTIRIAFDRFLLPLSVTRQSFQLKDVAGNLLQSPIITYDPVNRVVSLANASPAASAWLVPGLIYRVDIGVPQNPDDATGPRAIDQATLDPRGAPYVLAFRADPPTVADAGGFPRGSSPPPDFCADVVPLFRRSCAGQGCHGESSGNAVDASDATSLPALGLTLTTAAGVASSALNVLAAETSTGSRVTPSPPAARFGLDMPRIDPVGPGNSLLLYKALLGAPEGSVTATLANPDAALASPATPQEMSRLADLIPGAPMPYPGSGTPPLSANDLDLLSRWIAAGAATPADCPAP